jgi:hypothetical protein
MITRAQSLALLLVAAIPRFVAAQELVVVIESPAFLLDTHLSSGARTPALVVSTESPVFTLDTRLSTGSTLSNLVQTAESPAFTLDTRLGGSDPTVATLVVSAESAAFVLDTRLVGPLQALIVQAISPSFELNTMWIGIRRTARASGSPVELFWPTNAPGFCPQWALPPLRPSMLWQDVTNNISESGGFYRTPLNPEGTEIYFRLKL